MLIYYRELTLDEGFEALSPEDREDRLVAGKAVARPKGWALFRDIAGASRAKLIRCWNCGCLADRWIADASPKGAQRPVLNLYAKRADGVIVMMTRDHIIPKSLGGMDVVENLRPGCAVCNNGRGSEMTPEDQAFMDAHPDLVDEGRRRAAAERRAHHLAEHPNDHGGDA